jgi:hypothetical protein
MVPLPSGLRIPLSRCWSPNFPPAVIERLRASSVDASKLLFAELKRLETELELEESLTFDLEVFRVGAEAFLKVVPVPQESLLQSDRPGT